MTRPVDRREFLVSGVAASLAVARPVAALGRSAAVSRGRLAPLVVSSSNGHRFKNGGSATCVEKAFAAIVAGVDVLEAVLAGVNLVELDPEEDSVGYGGLPNADGVVQLDASCMHGPRRRAGAVACLEGVRTPSLVARAVMDHTDHHLLVGRDAQVFARNLGFTIEADLNTEHSRRLWLEWKRRADPQHYLDPDKRAAAGWRASRQMVSEGLISEDHLSGTINCNAVGPNGDVCGVTTTSGLAWKIPGRVGDSPILGAGLYVDNDVGAAGSTGRGEANLFGLSSFLIVESMRRGQSPKDAGIEALRRIRANTVERRLLNARGLPAFNVSFYIVDVRGACAGVSLYASKYAMCDADGPRIVDTEAIFDGKPDD
jgi:N4-(beta-N-acetylglucosaminyl)-L-asparaginase